MRGRWGHVAILRSIRATADLPASPRRCLLRSGFYLTTVVTLQETAPRPPEELCLMVTKQRKIFEQQNITAVLIQRMDCIDTSWKYNDSLSLQLWVIRFTHSLLRTGNWSNCFSKACVNSDSSPVLSTVRIMVVSASTDYLLGKGWACFLQRNWLLEINL